MFLSRFLPSLLAFGLASSSVFAADVYVVHGIDGTDLGLDQELLVDVSVDGDCALDDVAFGDATAALPFEPGIYDIAIRLSDGIEASCTGTLVAQTRLNVSIFETAVVVAHLDVNGAITLGKFTVKTDPIAEGQARVAVAHAAAAPPVDIQAKGTQGTKGVVRQRLVANGGQSSATDVSVGTYDFKIKPALAKGVVAKLDDVAI